MSQPSAVDGCPVEVGGLEVDGEEAVEGDGENVMAVVFVVVLATVGDDVAVVADEVVHLSEQRRKLSPNGSPAGASLRQGRTRRRPCFPHQCGILIAGVGYEAAQCVYQFGTKTAVSRLCRK